MKKINIRINQKLSNLLAEYARQQGVTKSSLVRQWLRVEEYDLNSKLPTFSSKIVSYSFTLTPDLYGHITHQAKEHQVSLNHLVTAVLQKKLKRPTFDFKSTTTQLARTSTFKYLWSKGLLGDLHSVFFNNFESLTDQEKYTFILGEVQRGDFSTATVLINDFKKSAFLENSSRFYHCVNFLEGYIAIHSQRNIMRAEQALTESWKFAHETRDRELIGDLANLKSIVAFFLENNEESIYWKEYALDFLDPIQYPLAFLDVLNDLMRLNISFQDWQKAEIIQRKIKNLLANIANSRLKGEFFRNSALTLRCQGKIDQSTELIRKALAEIEKTGSIWLRAVAYRDLGINLFLIDSPSAKKYINDAYRLENSIRPDLILNRSTMMELLVGSRSSYDQSVSGFQDITRKNDARVENTLFSYFVGTMQYLYGTSSKAKKEGEQTLREVCQTGSYPLIRGSALATLKDKQLGFFI